MPDYMIWVIAAIVVLVIVWVIFSKVLPRKKITDSSSVDMTFDIERFINALGGNDNIKKTEATPSKITVYVVEDTKVKITELKALGASGIVQSNDKVTIILGKISKDLSNKIMAEK